MEKGILTPIRIKRLRTATRERHEVATRRDTPTDSLAEYLIVVINLPSLEISRRASAPGREASKDSGDIREQLCRLPETEGNCEESRGARHL